MAGNPDFELIVGVDAGASFDAMKSGLEAVINRLNSDPQKVKLEFDLKSGLDGFKDFQKQIVDGMTGLGSVLRFNMEQINDIGKMLNEISKKDFSTVLDFSGALKGNQEERIAEYKVQITDYAKTVEDSLNRLRQLFNDGAFGKGLNTYAKNFIDVFDENGLLGKATSSVDRMLKSDKGTFTGIHQVGDQVKAAAESLRELFEIANQHGANFDLAKIFTVPEKPISAASQAQTTFSSLGETLQQLKQIMSDESASAESASEQVERMAQFHRDLLESINAVRTAIESVRAAVEAETDAIQRSSQAAEENATVRTSEAENARAQAMLELETTRNTTQAYQELRRIQDEIGRNEIKLAKLDPNTDAQQIERLRTAIQHLREEYDNFYRHNENALSDSQRLALEGHQGEVADRVHAAIAKMNDEAASGDKLNEALTRVQNTLRSVNAEQTRLQKIDGGVDSPYYSSLTNLGERLEGLLHSGGSVAEITSALKQLKLEYADTLRQIDEFKNGVTNSYSDAERAVKTYYSRLHELNNNQNARNNITLTENGWVSQSEPLNALAAALNKAKTAFDLFTNSEHKANMSADDQVKLNRLLAEEAEKYALAIEKTAQKQEEAERRQAEAAAEAERKKAEADAKLYADLSSSANLDKLNADLEIARIKMDALSSNTLRMGENLRQLQNDLAVLSNPEASLEQKQTAYQHFNDTLKALEAQIRAVSDAEREKAKAEKASADAAKQREKDEARKANQLSQAADLLRRMKKAQQEWTKAQNNPATKENYNAIGNNISKLEDCIAKYKDGKMSAEEFAAAVAKTTQSFKENGSAIQSAGNATQSWLGAGLATLKSRLTYTLSFAQIVMKTVAEIKKMISTATELDAAMNQLQIVTKGSDADMAAYAKRVSQMAKATGQSTKDLIDATTVYARLGYTMDESATLAKYTAMLQGVGDIDASAAQDAMTAIIKAFGKNVDEVESVMDKLVAVGNNFPISVSQLAEGMNNAGSMLAVAGNSMEQSIALLTAANTTTQDISKASTGLRTIAARIRKTTTELDDLGEAVNESKYEEMIQALAKQGVSLTTANGEYRSTYDILKDIASVWDKLSSMDQAAIIEALAGTRQQNVFSSLITQFQEAENAIDAMTDSSGALEEAYSVRMNSIEAHIATMKAAFDELSMTFVDSDLYKGLIDFLANVIEGLTALLSHTNALKTFLEFAVGIFATQKLSAIPALLKKLPELLNSLKVVQVLKRVPTVFKSFNSGTALAVQGTSKLQAAMAGLGVSINPVTAALYGLVAAISIYRAVQRKQAADRAEARANANAYGETVQQNNDDAEAYIERIRELKAKIGSGELSITELYEAERELLSIQDELTAKYGAQAENIDLLSSSAENAAQQVRNLRDALNEAAASEFLAENRSDIIEATREMEKVRTFSSQGYFPGSAGGGIHYSDAKNEDVVQEVLSLLTKYGVTVTESNDGFQNVDYSYTGTARQAKATLPKLLSELNRLEKYYGEDFSGIFFNYDMSFGDLIESWLGTANSILTEWEDTYDRGLDAKITDNPEYRNLRNQYEDIGHALAEAVSGEFATPEAKRAALDGVCDLYYQARSALDRMMFSDEDRGVEDYFTSLFNTRAEEINEAFRDVEEAMRPPRTSAEIEADMAARRKAFIAEYSPFLDEITSYKTRIAEAAEALNSYFDGAVPSTEDMRNYSARMDELESLLNRSYGVNPKAWSKLTSFTAWPKLTYADLESAGWGGILKYDNADSPVLPPEASFIQSIAGSDYTYGIRVTPVLEDGSVLSPASLQEYIGETLDFGHGVEGLFESDNLGIVLDVAIGEAGGGVDVTELQNRYTDARKLASEYFKLAGAFEKYNAVMQLAADKMELKWLYSDRAELLAQADEEWEKQPEYIALEEELIDALRREAEAERLAKEQRIANIRSLTSMSNELAAATAALEAYNKAIAGEHGELADSYSSAYQKFLEDWNAGKTGTKAVQAAVELFLPDDALYDLGYDLQAAGELLSSEVYQAIFNGENDPGLNFFNVMQEYAEQLGGIVDIGGDLEHGFTFGYSSLSELAYAFGISEEACSALLDSLDAYGVEVMYSAEKTANLAESLGLTDGAVKSTRDDIQAIANDLAAAGNRSIDIQRILQSLASAGYIDLSGVEGGLNDIIKAAGKFYVKPPEDSDVKVEVDSTQVDEAQSKLDALNTTTLTPKIQRVTVIETHLGGEAAMASGGVVKRGGPTLVNELGPELISENGRAYIAGGGEPTIVDLSPDAIVLDADETRHAISGKRKLFSGNPIGAAEGGIGAWTALNNNFVKPIAATIKAAFNKSNDDGGGGGGPSNNKNKNDKNDDDKQKIDWIEVLLDRLTQAIDTFGKRFENTAKTFDSRINDGFIAEALKIREGYERYQQSYDRYIQEANSVGLDEGLAALVRDGTIDIRSYDEETQKLISDYQTWYNKAIDCTKALEDLHSKLQDIYQARYDLVRTRYENQLAEIEHQAAMIEKDLDMVEARGYLRGTKYYQELRDAEASHIAMLNEELTILSKYFRDTMINGEIDEGSEAYYEMKQAIEDVEEAIADANLQLVEYEKTMRQLSWDNFDYAVERFKQMTEEADFFVELLSNNKLYQDNGQFTDAGDVTSAMHVLDYNAYMAQADAYARELQKIQRELAKDPYDTALIERREQLLSLQRESIQSAEAEKNAIRDLVSDGIDMELSALQDLIDAYNDSIDSAKDLYEYQKKVSEKTADIATIQKQLAAYAGDNSEENRARIQKLNQDLKKAQEDLSDTEREQSISEQKKLLDDLYSEYEELLTSRLDDVDALMREMIERTNANLDSILDTTQAFGEEVGYTITESFRQVLGDTFTDVHTVSHYLEGIYNTVLAMAEASGSVRAYASGGLVDYTGYAMLHGTPGRPELVLNAADTQNFLNAAGMLRRIPNLDTARFGGFGGTNIGAIEMNIQIDHVEDYNDLVSQMQSDPKFEKLVKAMTLDQITGKSGFRKNQIKF